MNPQGSSRSPVGQRSGWKGVGDEVCANTVEAGKEGRTPKVESVRVVRVWK
jgi:hypothetical protein